MRASVLVLLALAGVAMAQTDCVLEIDGIDHAFAHCEELVPGLTGYYEFSAGADGNVTGSFGLKAKSTGFAGWGLSPTGKMAGASAAVIADLGTNVVVGGYMIPSYDGAAINAANGTLPLTDAHAGRTSTGELAAVYSVGFPGVANSILDTTPTLAQKYIWVKDGTVANGKLAGHYPKGQAGNGDIAFNLKKDAPAPGASPMPMPMPSPKPVPPVNGGVVATAGAALAVVGAALLF
jgi:hypothetical protein